MKTISGIAVLAMGAAMVPMAALCQVQSNTPVKEIQTAGATGQTAVSTIPVEDQATKEQVTRLFEVMRVRQQIESMKTMMSTMMQQQVKQQTKELEAKLPEGSQQTPEQKAALEKVVTKYMDKAINIYPMEEMLNDMAAVYQRHMSRSDVEAFIAFYGSAPGQHLLDAQPLIAKEVMPMVMQRVQERTKELTNEMTDEVMQLKNGSGSDSTGPSK